MILGETSYSCVAKGQNGRIALIFNLMTNEKIQRVF